MDCPSHRQVDGLHTQGSIQRQNTGEKSQDFSWTLQEDVARLTS